MNVFTNVLNLGGIASFILYFITTVFIEGTHKFIEVEEGGQITYKVRFPSLLYIYKLK